jgi:hypothetical protein
MLKCQLYVMMFATSSNIVSIDLAAQNILLACKICVPQNQNYSHALT